jgi:hypothetical protein
MTVHDAPARGKTDCVRRSSQTVRLPQTTPDYTPGKSHCIRCLLYPRMAARQPPAFLTRPRSLTMRDGPSRLVYWEVKSVRSRNNPGKEGPPNRKDTIAWMFSLCASIRLSQAKTLSHQSVAACLMGRALCTRHKGKEGSLVVARSASSVAFNWEGRSPRPSDRAPFATRAPDRNYLDGWQKGDTMPFVLRRYVGAARALNQLAGVILIPASLALGQLGQVL